MEISMLTSKSHDPFCPERSLEVPDLGCYYCEIIFDVRNDATEKAIEIAVDQRSKFKAQDWDDAIEAIVSSLRNTLPPLPPEMGGLHGEIPDTKQNSKFFNQLKEALDDLSESEGEVLEEYMCPFCVTPWKCNGPHIEYSDLPEFEAYIARIVKEAEEGKLNLKPKRRLHDHLCNIYEETCCPHMGECECQCNCDFIQEIRADERNSPSTIPSEPDTGTVVQCDGCGEEYHRIGSNWWSMDGEHIRKWWDLMTEAEGCGTYQIVYIHKV
jgi:hypothetical protein